MIDLSGNRLQYYYHVIDEEDYAKAQQEYALYQECSYNFSLFQTMGTTSGTSKYDDVAMNEEYFDKENQTASEEFIFIVDFKNAGIDADSLMNKLLIELRDDEDQTIITVLGIEHEQLQYNIYANQDTLIELDASIDPDVIYKEHQGNLVVNTNLIQNSVGSDKINDTNYFDHQLGLKLTILDKDGEVVTGSTLLGFYYEIDGEKYYPNLDGTTRINIAERVANVESRIKLCTENANIPTGTYKVKIESFSSPDGIYFGLIPSDTIEVPFNFVNKIFGLKVTMPEDQVVYDAASGTNSVGTNDVTYQIEYSSGLGNPNIRIQWYRRTYEEIYSTTYEEADFQEYVSDILTPSENALEYKLLDTPQEQNEVNFHFNSNLKTGTYKLVFRLYDNDVYIGDIEKYIIID